MRGGKSGGGWGRAHSSEQRIRIRVMRGLWHFFVARSLRGNGGLELRMFWSEAQRGTGVGRGGGGGCKGGGGGVGGGGGGGGGAPNKNTRGPI